MSISYPRGESPKYAALRHRVDAYYSALLPPLGRMQATIFRALAFPERTKAAEETFRYSALTRQTIDAAVEIFLAEMAGEDRTRAGFVAAGVGPVQSDGVIQEQDHLAFVTGIARGADLVGQVATLRSTRQSPAVREMLDNAFTRLSENGKLRLEGVRDDIQGILTSAQDAGLSPLETGRQLAAQFDEYIGYEFERLARTEAAFAAEAGARAQMADLGVEQVEWLISAGACPICEDLEAGGPYSIDDEDNLPPAHPNCLCSVSPVVASEGDQGEEG